MIGVGRQGQECEGTRSLVLTLTRFCEMPIQFNAWEFNMQTRASLRLFNTKFTTFCVPPGSIKTLRVTKLWGFSRAREPRQGVGSLSGRHQGREYGMEGLSLKTRSLHSLKLSGVNCRVGGLFAASEVEVLMQISTV